MSFTKPDRKKPTLKKRCYRCGTDKKSARVKTYGANDWCEKCKGEVEKFDTNRTFTPTKRRPTPPRVPFTPKIGSFENAQPKPCQPREPEFIDVEYN
jgi:hypothetical protein